MLVCHCHAVRDREIRQCVRAGSCSIDAVGECTGAGTGCGGCQEAIAEIIDEELAGFASELPSVAAAPRVRHLPVVLSDVA